MEKLINSLPKKKSLGMDKNKNEMFSGFCLRFSIEKNKWLCGYGSRLTNHKDFVQADDPIEALADFVALLNKK